MSNKKDCVCQHYSNVQQYFKEIIQLVKNSGKQYDPNVLQDTILDILSKTDKMMEECEKMRDGAQKMENRLRDYRIAIERLGFKRI